MKYGEIWHVSFLGVTIGHEYKRNRPVLIVQESGLDKSSVVTIVPLTSNLKNKEVIDVLAKKDDENKLFQDSVIKIQHLRGFDKRRFLKRIGKVDDKLMKAVKNSLSRHLGL